MNEKKVREAIQEFEIEKQTCEDMKRRLQYATAIEALEKQLPKKPVFKRNAYGGISACPICGASDYGKYCRQCGQKIN